MRKTTNNILEYSQEIDDRVRNAVSEILNLKVRNIKRLQKGEVNYVYKVKTNKYPLTVRVARYKDWPNINKLEWIFKQLTKRDIPHPEILYTDTFSKYFKFGFSISGWINGKDGMTLIESGKLSRKRTVKTIAGILMDVHKIKIKGFGEFDKRGVGIHKTWEEQIYSFLEDPLYKRAIAEGKYKNSINRKAIETMKKLIKQAQYRPKSVLTHRDSTPENVIFNNNETVLIDWDNAIGSTWIEDLAWITFWMGKKAKKWYLDVNRPKESLDLIEKIEKIIHLRLALTNVPYYLYSAKNNEAAEKMNKRLKNLVSS